jgi:shikimate dehydrogenase
MKYGLVGAKLGHSFSREIHAKLGNPDYELRELAAEELGPFLRAREFAGINVTIPYKQAVLPYLDEISEEARAIGAVNAIANRGGKLVGTNTDFGGMRAMLRRAGIGLAGRKVLVLGTGGTSRTAAAVARAEGAREVLRAGRRPGAGDATLAEAQERHADAEILLNATPCGMDPEPEGMAIDPVRFPRLAGAGDAVYNPLRTRLVLAARRLGVPAEGGLFMLVAQAVLAAAFFGAGAPREEPEAAAERIYRELLREKENIVLTGMPGSGKTTLGRRLAAKLGRRFLDIDEEITRRRGMAIPDIFARFGEDTFRAWEAEEVERAARTTGAVVATGGGSILRPGNVEALRRNGKLFFLDRPPELLVPTGDRPLAATREALARRHAERIGLYRATADAVVPADGTPDEALRRLEEEWKK